MKKFAAVAGVCLAVCGAYGTTITLSVALSDTHSVGTGVPGVIGLAGGQAADEAADVNALVGMALNSSASVTVSGANFNPSIFARSGNFSSPLPTADVTGASLGTPSGSGTTVTFTLTQGFGYLVARYDGQNGGAAVWDLSGIAAGTTITIPAIAHPVGTGLSTTLADGAAVGTTDQYQITSYTLFSPTPTSTPDAGVTVAMLGAALTSLGLIRRKLSF